MQEQEHNKKELIEDIVYTLEGMMDIVKNDANHNTTRLIEMRDVVLSPYYVTGPLASVTNN